MIVVGLISGTSYDGIDCSIGEFQLDGDVISLHPIATSTESYSPEIYNLINSTMPPASTDFKEVCELDTLIGEAFADAASKTIERTGLQPELDRLPWSNYVPLDFPRGESFRYIAIR